MNNNDNGMQLIRAVLCGQASDGSIQPLNLVGNNQLINPTVRPLVDNVSIDYNTNNELEVKDAGISTDKLDDDAVTESKILNGAVTTNKIPDSNVTGIKIEVNERWLQNYCINDFRISQRTTPTALTTIANQGFGADRWKQLEENVVVQYRRYARGDAGSNFTNTSAKAYARFSKATNTGKFQIFQIVENSDAIRFISTPAIFRIKLRADASRTIRLGLVEWTGTIDTPTAAMVSAWNGNTTDPTLAASFSRIASVSCNVTTDFQEFTITGSPSSSLSNLCLVIWTDSQFASGAYIEACEPYLALGAIPRIWTPRSIQQELALCQRYYEKSYDIDNIPGTAASLNGMEHRIIYAAYPSGNSYGNTLFKTRKRASGAAVTVYSYNGTLSRASDASTAADLAANSGVLLTTAGETSCLIGNASGGTISPSLNNVLFHWTAEREL